MANKIGILVTSWIPEGAVGDRRLKAFEQAVQSWFSLAAGGKPVTNEIGIHLAMDSATRIDEIRELLAPKYWLSYSESVQERRGVGASLNAGIKALTAAGYDHILYAVDDWQLTTTLDLRLWAQLLTDDHTIGCVRFNPPHPHTVGAFESNWAGDPATRAQVWFARMERHHYVMGFRPALYHSRFFDYYGSLLEQVSSLDCETDYNDRFCRPLYGTGPDIVHAVPNWFDHLYTDELSAIVPGVS